MLQISRNIHKRNQPAPLSSRPPAAVIAVVGIHNFCDYLQQLWTRSFLQILKRLQKTPKKIIKRFQRISRNFFSKIIRARQEWNLSITRLFSSLAHSLSLPPSSLLSRGARARAITHSLGNRRTSEESQTLGSSRAVFLFLANFGILTTKNMATYFGPFFSFSGAWSYRSILAKSSCKYRQPTYLTNFKKQGGEKKTSTGCNGLENICLIHRSFIPQNISQHKSMGNWN
jgi:hypothetical protein